MPPARAPLLHTAPATGFDQAFDMLEACHARMERTLALMERLAAQLQPMGEEMARRRGVPARPVERP